MKASLRSVRIAPKKAQLIAKLVRNLPVPAALESLERTNKKAARIFEGLLKSAVANARVNDNQSPDTLKIMSLTVNKAQSYRRGVPMARGRVRPMRKFLSHINLTLGIDTATEAPGANTKKVATAKKTTQSTSQTSKTSVKSTGTVKKSTKSPSATKVDTTSSNSDSARTKTAKKSSSTS
jgi:large subunit ribosomal protein L22